MFYRGVYGDGIEGREMGSKRQRVVGQAGPTFGPPRFMYGNPTPPPMFSFSASAPSFPVVRLRGLPFDCTDTDVAEFFHGLDVVDILFVHRAGKFSGEAFCVFGYPLQVDYALQRNRQNMGRRYVEVYRSKRQDYYKAIANEVSESHGGGSSAGSPPPPTLVKHRRNIPPPVRSRGGDERGGKDPAEHTGVLKLRGLPFSAGKDDVIEFFKEFSVSDEAVHFIMSTEGRSTGEAFVEFASSEDSRAAMAKDRMTLGSRYIELFPSSHEELDEALIRGR